MIGTEIQQKRESKGWTRSMLSYASGVSYKTIREIEVGNASPRENTLRELFDALENQ